MLVVRRPPRRWAGGTSGSYNLGGLGSKKGQHIEVLLLLVDIFKRYGRHR